ncbi:MAG TPA: EAL domain-containing protein [Anaerolineales bacterium]|nr:EAL domain-containing protein [Anaerolineales bacterium]
MPEGNDLLRLRATRDAAIRAAQDAVRDTTRLTRLLTILSEQNSIESLLDRALATLSELFSADMVVLIDPAGTGNFCPLAAIGIPEDLIHQEMLSGEGSYTATALSTNAPVLTMEARRDPKVDPQLRSLDAETVVWLPVTDSHIVRGVLVLARCRLIPFAHADVDLLTAMAYRIGLVLEQAQRSIQLEQIVQTGREMGSHLDESSLYKEAVRMFPAVVRADAAVLIRIEPGNISHCEAQAGIEPEWGFVWCQLSEYLLEEVNLTGVIPYNLPDLRLLSGQFPDGSLNACPVRALLAIPIQPEDRIEHILYALRFSSTSFSPDTLQVAMLFTSQISAALENARLYQELRDELAERNRAEQALRASDERFRALIRSVSDVISILDADGVIRYVSPAAEVMWGCSVESLLGETVLQRVHPDDRETMRKLLAELLKQPNETLTAMMRLRQGQDTWRDFEVILTNLIDEPAVAGIVVTYHDVTERRTYEKELTKLAYRDPLTGLSNRAHFMEKLQHALSRASAEGHLVAVVFFDLDNFKIVNDSLGHDSRDGVLQAAAERIRACLRQEDTAARFGGDEFTVLLEKVTGVEQVIPIANRLLNMLHDPIQVDSRDLVVGCSMGIAVNEPNRDTAEDLLRKADVAMYAAKGNGKNCYAIFNEQLNTTAVERFEVETELRKALKQKELQVYYQPVVSLNDSHIVEVEALIRWEHPQRGIIPPSSILPLAEETGLIIELGQWILHETCQQVHIWQKRYPSKPPLLLSVNLSARQFKNAELVNDVKAALRLSKLKPSSLMLEIAESSLVHDPTTMIARLRALKNTGVRIAVDDLGTGYTSLSYLKQFPIDTFKIDRSFIQGITRDPRDRAIVRSIIELASVFGFSVVGKGIETDNQVVQLRALGCGLGQGFLFTPPLPPNRFETLLKGQHSTS